MTEEQLRDARLAPVYRLEVTEMPQIRCTGGDRNGSPCPVVMSVEAGHLTPRVSGTVTCYQCHTGTGFELTGNIITYVSGRSSYGTLHAEVPATAKALFSEAEATLVAAAPNATAAMCRASIEVALDGAGFSGSNLYVMIEAAGNAKALDYAEVGMAHASRLVTRDAIHRGNLVDLTEVPAMLVATVRILNKLYP